MSNTNRELNLNELTGVSGGRTNGDNPFVQTTMGAFNATTGALLGQGPLVAAAIKGAVESGAFSGSAK